MVLRKPEVVFVRRLSHGLPMVVVVVVVVVIITATTIIEMMTN